jgi:hypothetical protein
MTTSLAIGLSSWIIADGNYSNFASGDETAFALEFYAPDGLEEIEPTENPCPQLLLTEAPFYEVSGKCVHVDIDGNQSWWVIDAGILLYRNERPPENVRLGSWWRGKIYVGVDPFFYMERGSRHHEAPALIYDWKIGKIETRDNWAPSGWTEVANTSEGKSDEFVLHCTRQEGLPRR